MPSARKIKLRLAAPKPRNPLVAAAARRKAGAHKKSNAAVRRKEKMALSKTLRNELGTG